MRSTRFLFSGVLVGLCICLFAVSFSHASTAHEESKSDETAGANEEKHLKGFLPHLPTFKKPLHHSHDFPKKTIIPPKPTSSSLFKKLFHPIYKKPLPHPIPVYKNPFLHHPIPTFKKPIFKKPIPHHDHPIFKKPIFKKPIPHDHPIFKKPFFKKPIPHDHPIFKKPFNYPFNVPIPKKPFVPIVP